MIILETIWKTICVERMYLKSAIKVWTYDTPSQFWSQR